MSTWKEGDRVKIVNRPVVDEDRRKGQYYDHMADLTGTVQNVYSKDEIAVKVDPASLSTVTKDVHAESIRRMRDKFLGNVSEEQKKQLTPEELNFTANYVLLLQGSDIVKLDAKGS